MKYLRCIAAVGLLSLMGVAQESPQQTLDPRGQTIIELKLETLSTIPSADLDPYLKISVEPAIRKAWYQNVPYTAQPPIMKKGTVAVEFKIQPNGTIVQVKLTSSAGDRTLDQGVLSTLSAASPLSPMPEKFRGKELTVRGSFTYNPERPNKLILAHDIPTLFLPAEFRLGVKFDDETQWSAAGAYVDGILAKVRSAWYRELKEIQLPSELKLTSIRILIQPDGTISENTITQKCGSTVMDKAAATAISSAVPLSPLPHGVNKPLGVQLNFRYQPDTSTQPQSK